MDIRKGFMDGIGRKGRGGKSKKEVAIKQTYAFSERLDSSEIPNGPVENEVPPVYDRQIKKENYREAGFEVEHDKTAHAQPTKNVNYRENGADVEYNNIAHMQPTKHENNRHQINKKPDYSYYFSFILDTTADVAPVYDRIYAMLIRVVDKLEATRNHRSSERRKIDMKIGITTFHDEVSKPEDDKLGGKFFTDDFNAVRQRLKNLEFWGGNRESGRECINEAQLEGLKRMALQRDNDDEVGASCSQILITTSLPPVTPGNETGYVSFTKGDGDFRNRLDLGVRFALNIVLDKNLYDPDFKIVDRDGKESQEKSGYTMVVNIEDILNGIAEGQNQGRPFEDKADVVATIVNDLLEQTSLLSIMT